MTGITLITQTFSEKANKNTPIIILTVNNIAIESREHIIDSKIVFLLDIKKKTIKFIHTYITLFWCTLVGQNHSIHSIINNYDQS